MPELHDLRGGSDGDSGTGGSKPRFQSPADYRDLPPSKNSPGPYRKNNTFQAQWWNPKLAYEEELDPGFADRVAALPGAENILACIQCGTCAGACPMSPHMDFSPRRVIAMTREGFKQEVLSSFMIWLCSSCYACTVDCPKGIKITDVMYALKREAMREGIYPKHFAIPNLARAFFNSVRRNGRSAEGQVVVEMYLRTNPLQMLRMAVLGSRLFLRGRMSLGADRIRGREELRRMLQDGAPSAETKGARP
jgi:heterodisulfide reductase subunit C2